MGGGDYMRVFGASERVVDSYRRRELAAQSGVVEREQDRGRNQQVAEGIELDATGPEQQRQVSVARIELVECRDRALGSSESPATNRGCRIERTDRGIDILELLAREHQPSGIPQRAANE